MKENNMDNDDIQQELFTEGKIYLPTQAEIKAACEEFRRKHPRNLVGHSTIKEYELPLVVCPSMNRRTVKKVGAI